MLDGKPMLNTLMLITARNVHGQLQQRAWVCLNEPANFYRSSNKHNNLI